jgi:hypothetical protein
LKHVEALAVVLLALSICASSLVSATPTQIPPPPEYEQLYSGLKQTLNAYDTYLATLSNQASYPVIFGAELLPANGNRGVQLLAPATMRGVIANLDAFQSLGIQGVTVKVGFPEYAANFLNHSQYVKFFKQVAQEVRNRKMKLDIESSVAFANTQFSSITFNYADLPFDSFKTQMKQTVTEILQELKPDYLNLGAEPDTQAFLTGYSQFKSPTEYASYINFILDGLPRGSAMLGAGLGTWGNLEYARTLAANTSLDFIDTHVYPIVSSASLQQISAINEIAKQHGKWLNLDEAWLSKTTTLRVTSMADIVENYRRDAYSFWAPLDQQFLEAIVRTAQLIGIHYISPFWTTYFYGYVDYDQKTATMTYDQLKTLGNTIASKNLQAGNPSSTGKFYASLASRATTPTGTTLQESQSTTDTATRRLPIPELTIGLLLAAIAITAVAVIFSRLRSNKR